MAKRARRRTSRLSRPLIEELEPRLLFSADIVPLALDLPATGEAETPAPVVLDADLADTGAAEATRPQLTSLPLAFEENTGQTDPVVNFLARGSGFGVFLADGDAVLSLRGEDGGHVVRLALQGAAEEPTGHGLDALESESHYLLGAQEGHVTGVTHSGAVEYTGVYDGIDVRYYGHGRQLEYDFIVAPEADPEAIRLAFEGAAALAIAENGDLVLTLNEAGDEIRFQAPVSYQEGAAGRESVASAYVLHEDGSVGFELGAYDASRTLVIDPILDYGTYLGGTGTDVANAVAVDASGSAYVVGDTTSTDFPTTVGPIGPNNAQDVFVSKLSPDGSSLVFSTYIGGGSADNGKGIAVDAGGNVYVTGNAYSTDFPTTVSAFDGTGDGSGSNSDAFFLKLDPTGTTLLYSTYFGGDGDDNGNAIAIDAAGNAYLTGSASDASGFNITGGVVDTSFGGSYEAYVAKFDPTKVGGASLVYSTWLGGAVGSTGNDVGNGIAVDASGRAHVTGFTVADDFPTTVGAYQPGPAAGSHDAFVSVLDASASSLVYSSYLGGSSSDMGNAIAIDAAGLVYVTGESDSLLGADLPTTANAYQTSHGTGTNDDAFVAVFDPGLSNAASLLYSTYLGGNASDQGEAIAVDAAGRIYVTGRTASSDFATSGDALDAALGGSSDAFLTVLDPAGGGGADLVYSSYLGGDASSETGHGLTLDASDDVYVVGRTGSNDFSTTAGAFDELTNGGTDGFVAKFTALSNVAPVALWLTTEEDVSSPSGAPGLASWAGGEVLGFTGDPIYTFEPGTTTGTFASVFNLDDFVVGNDARVDSIHHVGSAMSVGSNLIPLQAGDLLISSVFPETLVNSDTSTVPITSRDVFIYRPDTPSNYAGGGTFIPLIVGADLSIETEGITLVEQTTTVGVGGGSVTLDPGDFLFSGRHDTGKIFRLQPGVLGDSATNTGTISLLVDANDLGVNQEIHGVELIESNVSLGDRTLTAGQILISTYADDTVAGTPVTREDVVILDIVDTGSPTTGTAEVLFEGADVGLNTWQESVWGISLVGLSEAPVLGANALTISEGGTVLFSAANLAATDTDDVDAGLTFNITGVAGGRFERVTLPGTPISSFLQSEVTASQIRFVHDGSETPAAYSVEVSDGILTDGPTAATITYTPINDAPTLGNGSLGAVNEDTVSPPGASITSLFGGGFSDPDGTFAGVAVVGNAAPGTEGVWQYSSDGGTSWAAVGVVNDGPLALAIQASSWLRFVPAPDYNGTPTDLVLRGLDDTYVASWSTTTPGETRITLDTSTPGDPTAIAAATSTLSTSITAQNDAPVLGANALTISEGGTVLFSAANVAATDVDNLDSGLTFNITGVAGGRFERVTLPGTPIFSFLQSEVTGSQIRFVHDGSETPAAYSVEVSDGSLSDGPTAATITYTPVNDAPTLGNGSLAAVNEDTVSPPGASITSLFGAGFSDPDGTFSGIAVVGNAAPGTEGVWEYSSDGGTSWAAVGVVNDGPLALAIQASSWLRFVPAPDYNGTPTDLVLRGLDDIYVAGWSTTTPGETRITLDTSTPGDPSAIAAATSTLSTSINTVNDAPTLGNGSLAAVNEDTVSPPGASITSLFGGGFSDPDGTFAGIAVVGNTAPGTEGVWQYSSDGGTSWAAVGVVNDGPLALAVQASSWLRFVPAPDYNGTPTDLVLRGLDDTYVAGWSTTTPGETRITLDTSTPGDPTAIAAAASTLSTSITAQNDAPVLGANALTISEGGTVLFSAANVAAMDVDNLDSGLTFNITGVAGGRFERVTLPGTPIFSFLQSEVTGSQIRFVHDDSETPAAYSVEVSDGSLTDGPTAATITYTPVNDAPTLGNGNLGAVNEDTVSPPGATITSLFGGSFSDPDSTFAGIAVVGNTAPGTEGVWEYSSDGGTTWAAVGVVNDGPLALAIQASSWLRFVPAPDYNGTPTDLVLRGLDDTYVASWSTTTPGETRITLDTSTPGDPTAIAAATSTLSTSITAQNDAPVLGANALTVSEGGTVLFSAANVAATDVDNLDSGLTFNITGVAGGRFERVTLPGTPIFSFLQSEVTASQIRFVHDDSETPAAYSVEVSDGSLTDGPTAATITYTPVNDAPTLGNGSLGAVNEDTVSPPGATITSLFGGGFSDPDGTFAGIAVVGNTAPGTEGVWEYSSDGGTSWAAVGAVNDGPLALAIQASSWLRFVPAADYNGTPTDLVLRGLDDNYVAGWSTTTPGETRVTVDTSTTGDPTAIAAATSTLSTSITAQNDAPVLGANALTISEGGTVLFSAANVAATDVDNLDSGLTFNITGVAGGRFERVTLPGTPIFSFVQSEVTANQIRFAHDGSETPAAYSVEVSDGSLTDGPTAATITYTPVNDAPTLGNGSLAAVNEDTVSPPGATITGLFGGGYSDPDGTFAGIAVVANAAPGTEGVWEYSSDGGTTWAAVGTVNDGPLALAIQASSWLRFVPASDYNGTPTGLVLRGLDDTYVAGWSTTTPGETRITVDTSTPGDPTAIAAAASTLSTSITAQNDAPVLGANALTISEGGTVLLGAANVTATDVDNLDSGLTFNIAGVAGGRFERVTLPGTPIFSFLQSEVTASQIRFVHDGSETPAAYSVEVSDGSLSDGPTAATITYTPVNDAPTLGNGSLGAVNEDTVSPPGASITSLFGAGFSDPDSTFAGIAVVGNTAPGTEGVWEYSSDGGTSWAAVGAVNDGPLALALQASSWLRFVPAADYNGTPTDLVLRGLDDNYVAGWSTTTPGETRITVDTSTPGDPTAIATATSTLSTSITAQNDAPVLGANALTISEGGTVLFSAANVAATDVDNLDSGLTFNITGVAGGRFERVTLPGTPIFSFLQSEVTTSQIRFVHDGSETPAAYSVEVSDGSLSDGPTAATITYTPVNDAPTLGNGSLAAVNEDTVSPPGASITSLFGAGFSDPDGTFSGIAVVGNTAPGTEGVWEYSSDGGTSWAAVGAVNDGPLALALQASSWLRFVPAADYNGTPTDLVLRGLDDNYVAGWSTTTPGETRVTVDTSTTGDPTAIATATSTLSTSITAQNDAPVLGANALTISEGGTVLFSAANVAATDVDNLDSGLTFNITGVAGGRFERVTLPGTPIFSFLQSEVTGSQIRFVHDGSETPAAYSVEVSDGSLSDGPTAATITYTPVNDAPTLGNGSLGAVNEDTVSPPGASITSLFGGTFSDPDGTFGGIAVVGNAAPGTEGVWQYSSDGGTTWAAVGVVNDGPLALTIQASSWLRFVPAPDYNGTPTDLVLRGLDDTYVAGWSTTTPGETRITVDTSTPGDPTAIAAATSTLSTSITAQNDAPVLGANALTISEGGTVLFSAANVAATDVDDADAGLTFTITGVAGGRFERVTLPGTPIFSFFQSEVTTSQIRFVHDGSETPAAYSVEVSDGSLTDGPTAATITYTPVNDAPTLGNGSLGAVNEDTVSPPGASITSLFGAGFSDPDGTFSGIAVVGNTAPGTEGVWQYSSDGGTSWAAVGVVNDGPLALALQASSWLRFVPAPDYNGTPTDLVLRGLDDTYVAGWSTTTPGETRITVDTSTTGDPTAIAAAASTLSTSIAAQNDAPVLGANALTLSEGGTVVLGALDLAATDVDDADPFLTFTVSGVTGGFFELSTAPGIPITSFLQSDVTGGLISFVDDGNEVAPSYSVSVSDGSLSDGPAAATISYTPVNDAPVLGNNALTVSEGGTVVLGAINLSATDVDDADASLVFSVSGVSGGQFERVSSGLPVASFSQADVTASDIRFVHDGNEAAPAYTVTVSDAGPLSDGPAAAAITFSNVNDAPTIAGTVAGQVTTDKSTRNPFTGVTIADVDLPGDGLTVDVSLDDPAKGVLTGAFTPLGGGVYRFAGSAAAATTAIQGLTFDPAENRVPVAATETTTFTISVDDATAPIVSDANTTVITTSINDAPTASSISLTVAEDAGIGTVVGGALASDPDPGDALTYSIIAGNSLGAFAIDPSSGTITVADPTPLDFETNPAFSLTIQVQDGSLATDTATVTVGVTNLAEVPILADPPPGPDPVEDPPPVDDPAPVDEGTEPAEDPTGPPASIDLPLVSVPPSGLTLEQSPRVVGDAASVPGHELRRQRAAGEPAPESRAVVAAEPLVLDDDMWRALDLMGADMASSAESEEALGRWVGSAAELGTMAMAAGFLTWFLRGGALLTSLVSSLPLWSRFDPLPVLATGPTGSVPIPDSSDEEEDAQEREAGRILDEARRPDVDSLGR